MKRRLGSILLFNLAVALAVEAGLRAAVGLGWLELPARGATWFAAEQRLYVPDRDLIYRLQPRFHKLYPARALFPGRDELYEVTTNARGFRTAPFRAKKSPGVFRILCMGDSSTFGVQVDDEDAYPQLLGRGLNDAHPGRFEVLNLGIPGHTTRQGIELLRREALAFEPDLVTFAYGTNDRFFSAAMSDDERIRFDQSATGRALRRLRDELDRTYTYRMLKPLARPFARPREPRGAGGAKKRRVSHAGMRGAIGEARRLLAERGASLVLLNNDLAATDAIDALEKAAADAGIGLLDMRALLEAARHDRSARLEEKLGLGASEPPAGKVLLRVFAPGRKGVITRVVRPGRPPVELEMRDDGSGGDQRPGDGVWSAFADGRPGTRPAYAFWEETDEGPVKEVRDNAFRPLLRVEVIPASRVADIDVFGEYYLKSDGSHPDEEGHRLIAERLYDHLVARDEVQAFLAAPLPAPLP